MNLIDELNIYYYILQVIKHQQDDSAEAARIERKRRQRLAKEEFLKKQMEQDEEDVCDVSPGDLIVAELVHETEKSGLIVKRKSPDPRGDEKRSKQI
ncbi:unnamed protein product [Danaus chrysippus]|uniref:(African queen) hypothetical protein n=1 Tax=Danaus chrysippus TaxID=151541 RepID=A0A8J2VYS9_9NEOP|nr:unnamed protein product [Danaus chrysippus]